MIWLTWRQFRVQALATLGAFVLLTAYLLILGRQIRSSYNTDVKNCLIENCATIRDNFTQTYSLQVSMVGILLIAVPALIGIFWGAPMVAREFEDGTHRLVWNQSVTRTRWLAVKIALVGLISLIITGALSLLLTWAASRFDLVKGDRFSAPYFDARNVVPLGYGLFTFVMGTAAGLILRRTLVAMAATLIAFAAIQILIPTVARAHYIPPKTKSVALTDDVLSDAGFTSNTTSMTIFNYNSPGAWSMTKESRVVDANGAPAVGKSLSGCLQPGADRPQVDDECVKKANLHFNYTYQPANRYWPFQWIELSIFVALSLLVAGLSFWWIRYRPS